MLHQMLISPFISFHPSSSSSSSSSSLSLPYSHSSQVEKEKKMEHESGNQLQLEPDQELAWAVEKGNHIFGEEFVDEFLDLGGLTETEKEDDDGKDNGEREKNGIEEEEDNSAVSFEPPPPVSDLAFPAHDVAELEWVSRLMDDSLSEFPPCSVAAAVPPKPPAQETSVVPVPEIEVRVRAKAKRSKRNRSPSGSWSNWGPPDYSTSSSSSSSTTTTTIPTSSSSCPSPSYSSSSPLIFFTPLPDMDPPPTKKQKIPKKRGRKPKPRPTVLPSGREENQQYYQNSLSLTSAADRRCSHCGVNKTPQWRAGPMGAKTLCNACGVRYKSGRLLPEYRPACSPTFVSHVHSNSHRKVLEMRKKKESVEQNQNDDNNIQVCSAAPAVPSF